MILEMPSGIRWLEDQLGSSLRVRHVMAVRCRLARSRGAKGEQAFYSPGTD
jgi:hypothetical protein